MTRRPGGRIAKRAAGRKAVVISRIRFRQVVLSFANASG
jgi:hypothetical protein